MLKRLVITLALGLCLAAAPTAAETPEPPTASVQTEVGLCASVTSVEPLQAAFEPELEAQAYCEASCTEGPNVSCSGSTCRAVDQSCPDTQGFVECDGSYQYCASCDSTCTCDEGAQCTSDSDCDCGIEDYGYCDKEPFEIVGTCHCSF